MQLHIVIISLRICSEDAHTHTRAKMHRTSVCLYVLQAKTK